MLYSFPPVSEGDWFHDQPQDAQVPYKIRKYLPENLHILYSMTSPYYIQYPIKDENNTEISALNLYRIIIKEVHICSVLMKTQWNFFFHRFPIEVVWIHSMEPVNMGGCQVCYN